MMYRKQENKESSKDRIMSIKWCCYITVDSEMHKHKNGILSYKLSLHRKTNTVVCGCYGSGSFQPGQTGSGCNRHPLLYFYASPKTCKLQSTADCRNTEKRQSGIGIFTGSQLLQSGIGIPAFRVNPVPLATNQSSIAQL